MITEDANEDMPISLKAKPLRIIKNQTITRLGGTNLINIQK